MDCTRRTTAPYLPHSACERLCRSARHAGRALRLCHQVTHASDPDRQNPLCRCQPVPGQELAAIADGLETGAISRRHRASAPSHPGAKRRQRRCAFWHDIIAVQPPGASPSQPSRHQRRRTRYSTTTLSPVAPAGIQTPLLSSNTSLPRNSWTCPPPMPEGKMSSSSRRYWPQLTTFPRQRPGRRAVRRRPPHAVDPNNKTHKGRPDADDD